MSFTNFLEHAVLDYVFGLTSYVPSGTLYVGLSTTTPTEAGGNFTEPASGYARVAVTNNKTNWSTATQNGTSGEIHNRTTITFPTSSGNWGTITHAGLFDHSGAGNLLTQAPLTNQQTVNINNTLAYASGAMIFRMD